jgi:hypothetical protein
VCWSTASSRPAVGEERRTTAATGARRGSGPGSDRARRKWIATRKSPAGIIQAQPPLVPAGRNPAAHGGDPTDANLAPKVAAELLSGHVRALAEAGAAVLVVEQRAKAVPAISDYTYVLGGG